MISIYNKYIGNDRAARSPVPVRRGQSPGILENSLFKIPDLGRTLSGILPDWLDSSDLLLLLMLLVINDSGSGVTGTLNTMMIMALLAGGSGNCNSGNCGTSPFPDG